MKAAFVVLDTLVRAALLLVVSIFLVMALARAIAEDRQARIADALPACQEDEVLVGIGAFHNHRWSGYVCGPAVDDYGVQS